jgi:hypothetical protein
MFISRGKGYKRPNTQSHLQIRHISTVKQKGGFNLPERRSNLVIYLPIRVHFCSLPGNRLKSPEALGRLDRAASGTPERHAQECDACLIAEQ